MDAPKRPNFTQDVTDKLVSLMEGEGLKPWEKAWDSAVTKAFNPYTQAKHGRGRAYRGGNAMNLLLAQIKRDSPDPRWLTFNQAKNAGFSVRKGARAETVMYWKFPEETPHSRAVDAARRALRDGGTENDAMRAATDSLIESMDDDPSIQVSVAAPAAVEDAQRGPQAGNRPMPLYSQVFNGADVVGLPPMKERRVFNADERAERLIQATGAVIEHREITRVGVAAVANRAFYDVGQDKVVVPPKGHFKSEANYYRTVVHEIAHWTGHESRLDRGLGETEPGSPEYAWEELRAEIASAMLCSALGIEGELDDHAAYLESYVRMLKEDRSAIFKAARDAEKIYDMVLDFDPELRAEVEGYMADNAVTKADPDTKKQQVFDLKKIIKGDLPTFAPKVVGPPESPTAVTKPEQPSENTGAPVESDDVEVSFGDLTSGGVEGAPLGAATNSDVDLDDDEISIDASDISDEDFEAEFGGIEVGGPQ